MAEPRASTGGAEQQSHAISHRRRDELILIGLTILAIIGIAITDFDLYYGLRYWLIMVPVFAGASIFAGWSRARAEGENPTRILRLQAFHWLASALAVYLVYLLQITSRMNKEAAGLVTLLTIPWGPFSPASTSAGGSASSGAFCSSRWWLRHSWRHSSGCLARTSDLRRPQKTNPPESGFCHFNGGGADPESS